MTKGFVNVLLKFFSGLTGAVFGKYLIIFFVSLLPILELRGGLIAASILHLNPYISFVICLVGNILPIPLILWFITPIFNRLKKVRMFAKFIHKLESRALRNKEKIEAYEFWGLLIFVGIPLPGTGAWTGALIAAMINMDKKKALIAIICGVIMAGIIMLLLSYGLLKYIIG